MKRYFDSVASQKTGLPLGGAQITVTDGFNNPVTLFADVDGQTVLDQPVLSNSAGLFSFYVADGLYTLTITHAGLVSPTVLANVEIYEDSRNLKAPPGDVGYVYPSAVPRAGLVLGFSPDGTPGVFSAGSGGITPPPVDGINLLAHGLPGIPAIRNDGADPGGINAAAFTAVLAYAAGLTPVPPVNVPYNANIGLGGPVVFPNKSVVLGEAGHQFVRTYSGGQPLFSTSETATVYIDGLAMRGGSGMAGSYFSGTYQDSYLGRIELLGSDGIGAFMTPFLIRTIVDRPKCRNMPPMGGNAGIRVIGGNNSRIVAGDVESGDDASQILPAAGTINTVVEYVEFEGGRYVSSVARAHIQSAGVNGNTIIRHCGVTGRAFLKGQKWNINLAARSGYPWVAVGTGDGTKLSLGLVAVSIRGSAPFSVTEVLRTTSTNPAWDGKSGAVIWQGSATTSLQPFVFDAVAKTIKGPAGVFASGFAPGRYMVGYDGTGVSGLNDNLISKILDNNGTVLTLETAPVSETGSYRLSDAISYDLAIPGVTGTAPSDLQIRRVTPGYIESPVLDAVVDDGNAIRNRGFTISGQVRGLRADLDVYNVRRTFLKIGDGTDDYADNRINLRFHNAAAIDESLAQIQYTNGLTLTIDGFAPATQPAVNLASRLEYDEDYPEIPLSVKPTVNVRIGGSVKNLSNGQAAVAVGITAVDPNNNVRNVDITGLTPSPATGATTAQLAKFGPNTTGNVGPCNMDPIAAGNTFANAVTVDPTASVYVATNGFGLPGFPRVGASAPYADAYRLQLQNAGDLTLAGDAITVTGNRHRVATEAAATADDLVTINGGLDGQLLILRQAVTGQMITVRQTGNIRLVRGDFTMSSMVRSITLLYSAGAGVWYEQSRGSAQGGITFYTIDQNTSFNVVSTNSEIVLTGSRTQDRNYALGVGSASPGDVFWVSNLTTGTGNAIIKNADVTTGTTLATLAINRGAKFVYDGAAWRLTMSGVINPAP